jgi:hypothetical protein
MTPDNLRVWPGTPYPRGDGKHNDANQEGNRDGTDNNNSWNCGA